MFENLKKMDCNHDCGNCASAQGCGDFDPASLIEKMEQEGVISAPNAAGKREILVPGGE